MPTARRTITIAAAGLLALAVLAGCGSESDVDQETFAKDLEERTGRPPEVVDCLTEAIYDAFDQDDVNRIYRAATEEELTDDQLETLQEINADCLGQDATAPTADPDDGDSGDGG